MAEILLYGIIGDTYDKLDASTVTTAIRASTGSLDVRINSAGGYVMEGLAIVEALRSYSGKVTIYIDGLAASMASVIAMVGTETIMAESALMMIHKPWDSSIGNADDLRRDAAKLDRIEAQLVGIYAKRTGIATDELSAMLARETWFTPEEALAHGFVTSIAAPLKIAALAKATGFGFRHVPDQLKTKEASVPDNPDTTTAAVALERTRISLIMGLGTKHRIPEALTQDLVTRGVDLGQASASILDYLAMEGDRAGIGHTHGSGAGGNNVTLDNPAIYCEAIRDALVAKIGGKAATGPAAEFRSMSVVDMGRDFLARQGERDVIRMAPDRVINLAMRPSSGGGARAWGVASLGGLHTTSDFSDLIGGAAEKFLVDRYKVQESKLKMLARKRDRPNFLMHYGVQVSGFGALDQVNEAGEFKNRSLSTRREGYKIDTFGGMFGVSRQMLVNDALGALSDILTVMAAGAAETEATILATLINAGPLMSDGKPWFDAAHRNIATTGKAAPSIATLDAGRLAMRSQKDLDGVGLIDANPKYLVVPASLQTAGETLVSTTVSPATAAEVNVFAGKLEVIADPRLSNQTAWFLFADPDFTPALQCSYLDGQDTPFLDHQEGWRVDGTEYKVRLDFGAGVLDEKMAWKNPGA